MAHHKDCSVRVFWLFLTITLLSGAGEKLWSQALTGYILGTVRDASGAVIPGAKLSLTQTNTGITFSTATDSGGNYSFNQLKPTEYALRASKEGFKTVVVPHIVLLVAQQQEVNVALQLGQVTQTIQVSATAAQLLESQTSSGGQVIQSQPIVNLPLNGRDFLQLAKLAPGVYDTGNAFSPPSIWLGGAGQATVSALGLREANVAYLVDGIEARGARWGNATVRPSPDAIQEFKIQTNSYSADTGRSSVVVNLAVKSGTNSIHGSAYEFVRNDVLNASNFFSNLSGRPKPPFEQNDFGGSLGGPVIAPHLYNGRDKTFFFLDYEGLRQRLGETFTGLFPSPGQLSGDLADNSAGTGIFPTNSSFCQANPASPRCVNVVNPFTQQPFAGNVIPTNMLNSVSQHWIPYMRRPNLGVAPNQGNFPSFNFITSTKNSINDTHGDLRIDQKLTDKDNLSGSYSIEDVPQLEPSLNILGGVSIPWRGQVLALNETHIFSPTVVNEFRFGYNRSHNAYQAETAFGPNISTDVFGLQNIPSRPIGYGIPDLSVVDFSGAGSAEVPQDSLDRTLQVIDNVSLVRGRHSIKLGGTVMHEKFYYVCDCAAVPTFSFTNNFSGSSLADMLLGIPLTAEQSVGQGVLDSRADYFAGYLQDDWRAKPNLTLNLGIRYEIQQNPRDINGREETFDFGTGQELAVFRGQIRNGISPTDYTDVGPRVGFAYSPSFLKNTVIRSSFGIFYATDQWNELGFVTAGPDFLVDQTLESAPTSPTLSMSSLFPPAPLGPENLGPFIGTFGVDSHNKTPYVQEWYFDAQHTFKGNWLADIGYAGNTAQRLFQRRDANTPAFDPSGTIPIQPRRPYPNVNFALLSYAGGWSSYNALVAKLEKRVTSNGFLLLSYTWSKNLDWGTYSKGSTASRDFQVYDRGNSFFEQPNRFVASYTYTLPFGRGMRFLSGASGALDRVIGGWKVDGITTFASGQYLTATIPGDYVGIGAFSSSIPNRIGLVTPANRTYNNWWTSTAFALPGCPALKVCAGALHVEGNAGRDTIEEPGINNWDVSLIKDTTLSERMTLEFRSEFFNAWNHTQFGAPASTLSAQFGRITGLLVAPREIQLAVKLLW